MKFLSLIALALIVSQSHAFRRLRHDERYLSHGASSSIQDFQPRWFNQTLDHFNSSVNATFLQKYYVNDTIWAANGGTGPVLLSISGESSLDARAVAAGTGTDYYAQQLGAMIVSLEHRYYGESVPFGGNVSAENMRFLHSKQALADLASFIDFMRASKMINETTPVISIGGSYAGAMSAWLKSQYPSHLAGALASSGPVHAEQDFHEYMQVVAKGLGEQCTSLVQNASQQLDVQLSTTQGRIRMDALFGTNSSLANASDKDIGLFVQNIVGPLTALVQYNTNYRPINITTACDYMANASRNASALQALAEFNYYYNNYPVGMPFQQPGSVQVNYSDYLAYMQQNSADRSWTYQCCNEFGWWQTSEDADQPFTRLNSLAWQQDQCKDIFGIEFNTTLKVDQTNAFYGGRTIKADNLFMSNGATDPWHFNSIYDKNSGSLEGSNTEVLLIGPTSHCQDIGAPHPSDIPQLVAARQQILAQLQSFINPSDDAASDLIWIIAVSVIGALAVLGFIVCVVWRMKQSNKTKAETLDEESQYARLTA